MTSMTVIDRARVPAGVVASMLLLGLASWAGRRGTSPPAPVPRASEAPAPGEGLALVLHFPLSLTLLRATVRDPERVVTATCRSRPACERLERWATRAGRYVLALDYLSAGGEQASFEVVFFAGYGETSIELTVSRDETGEPDSTLIELEGAPQLEGVALRQLAPSEPGKLPRLELVNGSSAPIYVHSQGGYGLLRILASPAGSPVLPAIGCGTGAGLIEVLPGTSIPAMRSAAIGRVPPLGRGLYRVGIHYGVNEYQEFTSLGAREVSLDVEVEGLPASTPAPRRTPSVRSKRR